MTTTRCGRWPAPRRRRRPISSRSKLRPRAIADHYALVDGGVFANNPAMCAFADAHRFEEGADIVLVSLGTGQLERPIRYDDAKDWGMLEWARPILDVVFDASPTPRTTSCGS